MLFPTRNANSFAVHVVELPLSAFTLCFWLKTSSSGTIVPVSYSLESSPNELEIRFIADASMGEVVIHGKRT